MAKLVIALTSTYNLGDKTKLFGSNGNNDLVKSKTLLEKDETDGSLYQKAKAHFSQNKKAISLATGQSFDDNSDLLLFQIVKNHATKGIQEIIGYLVVEWKGGAIGPIQLETKELADKLESVSDENAKNWCISDDRYNGIDYSKNGFWADLTKESGPRETAKIALQKAKTQKEIDDALAVLTAAISKLIPSTRANTTLLYEELLNTPSKDDYTPKTWAAYSSLRSEAEAMMASMFDKDGNPTEANSSDKQQALEDLAARLAAARKALDERAGAVGKEQASFVLAAIDDLVSRFDPDKLSGYTQESLDTLREARTQAMALAAQSSAYSTIGSKELQTLYGSLDSFRAACYQLRTESTDEISVSFSAVDATGVYLGKKTNDAYTGTLTLPANATVLDALNAASIKVPTSYDERNAELLYINGEQYYSAEGLGPRGADYRQAVLHDGDTVTWVRFRPKLFTYSSGVGQYAAFMTDLPWEAFRYQQISLPQTVTAGQPFEICVTSTGALPNNRTGGASPVSGAAVYTSAAFADKADAAKADVLTSTYVSTGADGTAQLTLYAEGWTAVNAFRLDDEGRYTNGPTVLVYVEAADDLNAIKTQLRKELDAVYYDDSYPESSFSPENWTKLTAAYNAGVSGIEAAATSGAAREAQMTALQAIKQMQQEADSSNRGNLEIFRQYLNRLPDDAAKLDEASKDAVERLISAYQNMTEYQKGELTAREQEKYDAIAAAYEKGLAQASSYSLSFEQKYVGIPEADQQALERMSAVFSAGKICNSADSDFGIGIKERATPCLKR